MVIHQFIIKLGKNWTKKNRNFKVRKLAEFLKQTINFKVMKTIRNQLKYPIGLQLPMLLLKGFKNSWYSIFMQLQKEQQIDMKLKINSNLPLNALEAVKPYFGPQNMFD